MKATADRSAVTVEPTVSPSKSATCTYSISHWLTDGLARAERTSLRPFATGTVVAGYYRVTRKNGVVIVFRASTARFFWNFRIFALPKTNCFSDPRGVVRVAKSKFLRVPQSKQDFKYFAWSESNYSSFSRGSFTLVE